MPWLHHMRWPEVENYLQSRQLILIPVGSTEQHGRHAPLGTDSFVAIRLAEDASRETGALVAPPLFLGWSPHHMVLPGTISIDAEVLSNLVFLEIESLAHHGFARCTIVNGHRITNLSWLQIAAQRAQSELDVELALFDPAYMSREIVAELGFGPFGHAEEIETSHMLHIHPELVNLEEAVDGSYGDRPLYDIDPRSTKDTLAYLPSRLSEMQVLASKTGGSSGHPTRARADLGRQLHEHLVRRLIQVTRQLEGLE